MRATSDATLPLLAASRPDQVVAWRRGHPVRAAAFLADVSRVASALPPARHVINLCGERYRFAVVFCAAQLGRRTCLLPPNHAPALIDRLRRTHDEVLVVADGEVPGVDGPVFAYPDDTDAGVPAHSDGAGTAPAIDADFASRVPRVPVDHVAACVFTSGSTGEPSAHPKSWGMLVRNAQGAARRLGIGPARTCTLLGTVPGQHMYGFESTILLALHNGVAFHGGRPFYPADVVDALGAIDGDRVLVTTPFHLRSLLAGAPELPPLRLILCATAPLSAEIAAEAERRLGAPLLEIYGCTEAGQIATRRTVDDDAWTTFDGVRIDRRDDGWFASGGHVEFDTRLSDRLELLDPTHFRLLGRDNDMVNVAGKRTSIGYLDAMLLSIPGVEDAAFVHREGRPGEVDRLTAFFVGAGLEPADVIASLRRLIDPVFLPRPLHRLERLPRIETGKLPRETLLALADRMRDAPRDR
ncbi:MAG: AMP-binding protein [Lautropia sp.]